jgi:hypothetical protein
MMVMAVVVAVVAVVVVMVAVVGRKLLGRWYQLHSEGYGGAGRLSQNSPLARISVVTPSVVCESMYT